MYTAELPRELHVKDLIKKQMAMRFAPEIEPKLIGPAVVPKSVLGEDNDRWKVSADCNCLATNIHTHTFTCHKPHSGSLGCRLARPFGICPFTSPSTLHDHDNQDADSLTDPTVDFVYKYMDKEYKGKRTYHIDNRDNHKLRNVATHPIPKPDDRVLVWELRRPELAPLPHMPDCLDHTSLAAKHFCIAALVEALSQDATNDLSIVAQVTEWMEASLKPQQVVDIYNHISDDLPARNGLVTEFNDTIINATGSAVNCILLGNTTQSKNALFYLAPYIGKSKVSMVTSLTTFNEALKYSRKHGSTAPDSGTNKRTAQYILTRTLNSLNKSMEVSDTQAVLGLMGLGSQIRSHHFQFYSSRDAVQYVTTEAYKSSLSIPDDTYLFDDPPTDSLQHNDEDHASCSDSDSFISDTDDFQHIFEQQSLQCPHEEMTDIAAFLSETGIDPATVGQYQAKATLYRIPSESEAGAKKIPVCYQTHYRYRGEHLASLSRHEYTALIAIKEKKTQQNVTNPGTEPSIDCTPSKSHAGRKPNATFEFAKGHPLHATHVQYIRSKQPVIIFNGKPPVHPGSPPTHNFDTADPIASSEYHKVYKAWKIRANKFAMHWLVAFRPEISLYSEHSSTYPSYSWEALCLWIAQLEASNTLISKFRYNALVNAIYGTYGQQKARLMMSAFRMRSRTIWSQEEKQNAKDYYSYMPCSSNNAANSAADDMMFQGIYALGDDPLKPGEETRARYDYHYSLEMHNAMDKLFPLPSQNDAALHDQDGSHNEPNDFCGKNIPPLNHLLPHDITKVTHKIVGISAGDITKQMSKEDETTPSSIRPSSTLETSPDSDNIRQPDEDIDSYIDRRLSKFNMATRQSQVLQLVRTYLTSLGPHFNRNENKPIPLRLLVTGMPGTGKSFVIDRICDIATWLHSGHIATMAFNGIAAVNIDGGTLCSMLSIHKGKTDMPPLSATKKTELHKVLQIETLALLVVDEVSNIDAFMMAAIHTRLQELTGNRNEPFGGLSIVFFGDFSQLPPVKSISITHTLMMTAALYSQQMDAASSSTPPANNATETSINSVPLTSNHDDTTQPSLVRRKRGSLSAITQQRKKAKKTKTLNSFGSYGPNSYKRKGADLFSLFTRIHLTEQKRAKDKKHLNLLKSMSNGLPITMADLSQYKKLTKHDIYNTGTTTPSSVHDPISPTKETNDTTTSWKFAPVPVANNRERLDIVARKTVLFAHHHRTFAFRWKADIGRWQGCPKLPEEQLHLQNTDPAFWQYFVPNADAFLTNNLNTNLGLANGTPIRLHSLTFASQDQLHAVQSEMATKPPGSVITLDEPPLAVNLLIPSTFDCKTKPTKKKTAQLQLLEQFSLSSDSIVIPLPVMKGRTKYHGYALNSVSGIGKVTTKDIFPYELAFAMTVHKAQGRTIPRVVLALAHRENSNNQMTYASIYVALSRVKLSTDLRIMYHDTGPRPGILGLKYIGHLKHCIHVLDYYHGFSSDSQGGLWNPRASLVAKRIRLQTPTT